MKKTAKIFYRSLDEETKSAFTKVSETLMEEYNHLKRCR